MTSGRPSFAFGPFLVDPHEKVVLRDGQPLPLTPKAIAILLALLDRHGHIVDKDDLMQAVWPDTAVEEGNLTQHVYSLRKTLGSRTESGVAIETVSRRGYRLVGNISLTETPPIPHLSAAVTAATMGDAILEREPLPATAHDDRASIVVLPFANLNADPANEFLTDGLTEELIGTLASVAGLMVVARTSAFHFKGRTEDIRKIGQDLGVRTALEGSVRIHDQRIRVTSHLIDVGNGLHLWSEIFDRTLGSIFDIQEEIAHAIVDALRVRLAPDERARLRRPAPPCAEAHEHYLKGKHFWHKNTPADAQKSAHHFERAIALDPAYGAAHAGLADAFLLLLSHQAEAPNCFVPKARHAAENALTLEDSAEAHTSMGMVFAVGEWNWTAAEQEFRRALHLKPSFAYARMLYAVTCLCPVRRHREAVAELRKSIGLDPLAIFTRIMLGQTLVLAADGESAVSELHQALDLEPGHVFGHITLALAYLSQARHRDAVDVLEALGEPGRAFPNCLGHLGFARGILGDRTEAERILGTLLDRFKGGWVPSVDVAAIHNGLGDIDGTIAWLTRARRDRSFDSLFVLDDPRFVNLRSKSSFIELFAREA